LKELSFKYDSSIFPMQTPLYGLANGPTKPYYIDSKNLRESSSDLALMEFPISVLQLGRLGFPFAGGIYARFLPTYILEKISVRFAQKQSLNFYFHPWEIGEQRITNAPIGHFKKVLAHYNSRSYLGKIERLLQKLEFTSVETWMQEAHLNQ
jgi:peptidoglycan-N-acetylglucosamine deacetylase